MENKSQLILLAGCIFGQSEFPNHDCSTEQMRLIELNLYNPILKVLSQINNITRVTKQDLMNQGTCLIHKKHIIDLNRLYDCDSDGIQAQATNLISTLIMNRDYKAMATLGSLLHEKKWYEVKLILDKNMYFIEEQAPITQIAKTA